MFKYYQPNDKDEKDEFGDCAMRALCLTEDIPWLDAYDLMYKYSREIQCPMNCKYGFEHIMRKLGYEYVGISNKKGSKRPTVKQMSRKIKDGKKAIAVVANHYVAMKDGNFYDTWDSGYKSLYGYWIK